MIKKLFFACCLLVLLLIGFSLYSSYRNKFQAVVVVSVSQGTHLSIYAATGVHESTAYDASKLFVSTSAPGKFRLKKGEYVYVVTGQGKDFQSQAASITLDKEPLYISPPALGYTTAKLASLLPVEEPVIKAAIVAKYPSQMNLYSVQSGRLYKNGDWYGAVLAPNDPNTYDTLRIVLKNGSSGWKVVTDPPEIVLSQPVYPAIPPEILIDLDSR